MTILVSPSAERGQVPGHPETTVGRNSLKSMHDVLVSSGGIEGAVIPAQVGNSHKEG